MNNHNNHLLEVLTREGVLINVSVRYWRAAKKLKPEDLGLDPDNVTERLISLGHKKLLPKEKLEAFALIESRAHALVEASTFPFLDGLGHFLPNAKLQELTGKPSRRSWANTPNCGSKPQPSGSRPPAAWSVTPNGSSPPLRRRFRPRPKWNTPLALPFSCSKSACLRALIWPWSASGNNRR
jgi:hypothetical protein